MGLHFKDESMAESVSLSFKKNLVKQQACFAQLKDDELEVLASLFVEKLYKAGETIVTEGDPVDSVYLIVRGTAEVRHLSVKNNMIHIEPIATLKPNEAIGLNEVGFYSLSGLRTATVVAVTDIVLLRLSVAAFNGFALENSHVNKVMRQNAEAILKELDNAEKNTK